MKLFKSILFIAAILFITWIALSFIDIVQDNSWYNPQHSPYNFFYLIVKNRL